METAPVHPIAATGAAENAARTIRRTAIAIWRFVRSTDPARWAGIDRIVLLTRQSGEARELPPTFDERPALLGWTGDSAGMLFSEARGTANVVYAMPVDGQPKAVYEPRSGTVQSENLNSTGTAFGFSAEMWNEAPEAYLLKIGESVAAAV